MEQIYILWIMDLVFQPSQRQTCILLIKYVYMYMLHVFCLSRDDDESDYDGIDNVVEVKLFLPLFDL